MTILEPVQALPPVPTSTPYSAEREHRRRVAYLAAKRAEGLWLPVECDEHEEARRLAKSARTHSRFLFEAEQRGRVCYLRFLGRNPVARRKYRKQGL